MSNLAAVHAAHQQAKRSHPTPRRSYKDIDKAKAAADYVAMPYIAFVQKYGKIPDGTLRGWVACLKVGKKPQSVGRPLFLDHDKESEIFNYVKDARQIGGPIDLESLVVFGEHLQQNSSSSSNDKPAATLTRTWARHVPSVD